MYSKCHSMYLKWTYFCNRHMCAILHWESCRQNNIINSIVIRIVIHCTIRLNVCHNKLFLPNLWKCRYHVYWNLSYPFCILKVIFSKSHNFDQRNQGRLYRRNFEETLKKNGAINRSSQTTQATFTILISVKWNLSSHILYFIYM